MSWQCRPHYVEVSCCSMPKCEKADDQLDRQCKTQVVELSCPSMPKQHGSGFRALDSGVCCL